MAASKQPVTVNRNAPLNLAPSSAGFLPTPILAKPASIPAPQPAINRNLPLALPPALVSPVVQPNTSKGVYASDDVIKGARQDSPGVYSSATYAPGYTQTLSTPKAPLTTSKGVYASDDVIKGARQDSPGVYSSAAYSTPSSAVTPSQASSVSRPAGINFKPPFTTVVKEPVQSTPSAVKQPVLSGSIFTPTSAAIGNVGGLVGSSTGVSTASSSDLLSQLKEIARKGSFPESPASPDIRPRLEELSKKGPFPTVNQDILSQLKEVGKKGPSPTVSQDLTSQLKEIGQKGPFPTVNQPTAPKPGTGAGTSGTKPATGTGAGTGTKPEERPAYFTDFEKNVTNQLGSLKTALEGVQSQSKTQPSPVPSDISVPRGQSSAEAAFPLNEFEDLLFRMEASKGRQKRQESIEGRRNIFAQGLAQMMASAF